MAIETKKREEMRADGRRNRAALLDAARVVFGREGIDASLQTVAAEAGVGRGSLYRHFPTREALFAAIMADQVEDLRQQGEAVLAAPLTAPAVAGWLEAYAAAAKRYPGMSAQMAHGLGDDDSPISRECAPMKAVFDEIYAGARQAGVVRGPLSARQVLMLVATLPADRPGEPAAADFIDVVFHGLLAEPQTTAAPAAARRAGKAVDHLGPGV